MSDINWIDIILKSIASIAIVIAILQLNEAKRKRLVDMYWKIADLYTTDEQMAGRRNLSILEKGFIQENRKKGLNDDEIIHLYNQEFHEAVEEEKKKIDISIMRRVRYLNQIGVLLRKQLIDKDLTFGLIGAGLEIEAPTIRIVLEAHRRSHNLPYMYNEFETVYSSYLKWNKKSN